MFAFVGPAGREAVGGVNLELRISRGAVRNLLDGVSLQSGQRPALIPLIKVMVPSELRSSRVTMLNHGQIIVVTINDCDFNTPTSAPRCAFGFFREMGNVTTW